MSWCFVSASWEFHQFAKNELLQSPFKNQTCAISFSILFIYSTGCLILLVSKSFAFTLSAFLEFLSEDCLDAHAH